MVCDRSKVPVLVVVGNHFESGLLNLALEALATAVQLVDVFSQCFGAGLRIGRKQFNGQLRLAKPARSIQARANAKRHIFGIKRLCH